MAEARKISSPNFFMAIRFLDFSSVTSVLLKMQNFEILLSKIGEFVRSLKMRLSVIPAKAGIQISQIVINSLDSGFHRSDDFLRDHQNWFENQPLKSPQPPFH
jgi:hypothetical protein